MLTIDNIGSFGEYYVPSVEYDNIQMVHSSTNSKVVYKFTLILHRETVGWIFLHRQKCTKRNQYYIMTQTNKVKTNKSGVKHYLKNSDLDNVQNFINAMREWLVDIKIEK